MARNEQWFPVMTNTKKTLHFVRHFTAGNLVGLTHESTLDFESADAAFAWVAGVNRNNRKGTVDYLVTISRPLVSK